MSASLVGSEMCIRDSPSPADLLRLLCSWAADAASPGHGRGPPMLYPSLAVSYTHLTLPTICSV
eukprot:2167574-Alexandrium_andersonii.AAC.1